MFPAIILQSSDFVVTSSDVNIIKYILQACSMRCSVNISGEQFRGECDAAFNQIHQTRARNSF